MEKSAAWCCAALHVAGAIAAVTLLRGGPAHATAWRAGWLIWMAAALSLIWFYSWWARRAGVRWPIAVALAGILCDYAGELIFIVALPAAQTVVYRIATLLTAGAANALYTIAGMMLTLASTSINPLLRWWAWLVWTCGAALTIFAIANVTSGMVIASAALMIAFVPWVLAMGAAAR